ncbi:hypothetical protein MGN70_014679 [Eutypa lata]|nr:hypothetical protein MGN70_014679 [Eutypa lata]
MEPAGWTFQEQILSTRLVRYSDDEARWMYGSRHAYECGTVTDDHPRRQSLTTVRQLDTPRKVYSYWTNLINDRAESNYIAGLWFDDLLQGLCWSRSTAAHGPVIYYERDEGQDAVDSNLLPRCVNALSTVDGKNPFVVVKDGWIKVRSCPIDAVYITGRLHYKGGEEPENFDPDVELSHFSFHDNDGTLQSSAARTTPMIALGKEPPLDDDGNRFLSKHNCENEPAWLLYLGSRASETLQNTYSSMLFLVLGRSPRRPAMF